VNDTQDALAAVSFVYPKSLQGARDFLAKHKDIDVLRYYTTDPISGAPAILDHAVGVAPDLEWYSAAPKAKITEQLENKITQVGWTVFPMSALKDCKSPEDFPRLIKKAAVYYIRVIDTCHLRSKAKVLLDAEYNPLYCPTRFVSKEEAKSIFKDVLDNQILEDGSKAAVILIGHAWDHDEANLKKDWSFSVGKLDSIVYKVFSLAKLAVQAGIIPAPSKALGESLMILDVMLERFQVDMTGIWRHNGANDAVYQMTLAFLIIFFPMLYFDATSGFPIDPSISGLTIKDIWADLAEIKNNMTPVDQGFVRFCYYCDTPDDHDGTDESPCPVKDTDIITCQLCINTVGRKNKAYCDRAHGHQTHRCTFQWSHYCREFPEVLKPIYWSLEDKRALTRGFALGR
jgi:hypothetical protein